MTQKERERKRREKKRRKERLLKMGLCVNCGQAPAEPNKQKCEPCLQKGRIWASGKPGKPRQVGYVQGTPQHRFWFKVDRTQLSPGGCWVWTAFLDREGYGRFKIGKSAKPQVQFAHKWSFLEAGGVLTKEKYRVLHICNNRPCVNPAHLYAGDQKDNMQDAIRAGTLGGKRRAKEGVVL
jgi:hypothetical protein